MPNESLVARLREELAKEREAWKALPYSAAIAHRVKELESRIAEAEGDHD